MRQKTNGKNTITNNKPFKIYRKKFTEKPQVNVLKLIADAFI